MIILLLVFIFILVTVLNFFIFDFIYYIFPQAKKSQGKVNNSTYISQLQYKQKEKIALVQCNSNRYAEPIKIKNKENMTCQLYKKEFPLQYDCGCIGLGSCKRVCPQNAIKIETNTAVITEDCNGCGKCIAVCPQNLITLVPINKKYVKLCNASDSTENPCAQVCTFTSNNDSDAILEEHAEQCKQKCIKKTEVFYNKKSKLWYTVFNKRNDDGI